MYLLIRRENRSGSSHLRTHIGDGRTLRHFQCCRTRSHVLVYISKTAFDRNLPQHFENDFFGIHTRLQFSGQIDFDHTRHFQTHRNTCHRRCDIHSADTDAEHADRAAVRSVAVTSHTDFSRRSKSCHMNGMADSISRSGYVDAEFFCRRCQINMVVRCFVVDIEQIVIQIADAAFGADTVKADGFKGKIRHNRIDVMGQCLIHFDKNFFPRNQTSGYIV